MREYHTVRLTASAAIQLPRPDMHLVKVRTYGGATPGSFSLLYDGQANAHFPAPSDGTNGEAVFAVEWSVRGSNIPAASVLFNGGVTIVELTFSVDPGEGRPISSFRAIRFARTDGGAVTANVAVNYDVGPNVPRSVIGQISASAGRAVFPAIGASLFQHEAGREGFLTDVENAPELPRSNSLTLSVITDAAATSQYLVYY